MNFRRCKLPRALEDELIANRLDLQLVGDARQVANNLLEVGGRQIDYGRELHIRIHKLLLLRLNEAQLLGLALLNLAILKL